MPAKLLNHRVLSLLLASTLLPAAAQAQFGQPPSSPPPGSEQSPPARDNPPPRGGDSADKQRASEHVPVMTEAQKRCRVENRCRLDPSPCRPCQ
jgi:hypothetical protein